MPEPVWTPSLQDTEQNRLSVRLRDAVRAALPELVRNEWRDTGASRQRAVEVRQPPDLSLRLEARHVRSVVVCRRPVLEVWFDGMVRSPDSRTGEPMDTPITGECRLDLNSGAIVHLRF